MIFRFTKKWSKRKLRNNDFIKSISKNKNRVIEKPYVPKYKTLHH